MKREKTKHHANMKLQISWLNRQTTKENSPPPFQKTRASAQKRDKISDLLLYSLKREHQVYQKHYSIISVSHIVQSRI